MKRIIHGKPHSLFTAPVWLGWYFGELGWMKPPNPLVRCTVGHTQSEQQVVTLQHLVYSILKSIIDLGPAKIAKHMALDQAFSPSCQGISPASDVIFNDEEETSRNSSDEPLIFS